MSEREMWRPEEGPVEGAQTVRSSAGSTHADRRAAEETAGPNAVSVVLHAGAGSTAGGLELARADLR